MTAPNQPLPADVMKLLGIGAFQVGQPGPTNYGQNITEGFVNSLIHGPATALSQVWTNLEDFLVQLGDYLKTFELQALKMFQGFIPDATDADFADVDTAVATILDALGLKFLLGGEEFQQWLDDIYAGLTSQFNQIVDIFNDLIVVPINAEIQAIKDWWDSLGIFRTDTTTAVNDQNSWWGRLITDLTILLDFLHLTYQPGSPSDAPTQLGTNGKRTWYSAWNDLMNLFGVVKSTTALSDPSPTIGQVVSGTVNAINAGITGTTATGSDPASVQAALGGLQQTVAGIQDQVGALQAPSASPTTILSDDGKSSPGSGLGSSWTGSGTNTVNRDAINGFDWAISGSSARTRLGIYNTPLATKDQVGQLVINKMPSYDPFNANPENAGAPYNQIILRANSPVSPTSYVFARIRVNHVQFGYCASGVENLLGSPTTFMQTAASAYTFYAGDSTDDYKFTLMSGGRAIATYTDAAHASSASIAGLYPGQSWTSDAYAYGGEARPASTSWRAWDASASAGTPINYGHVARASAATSALSSGMPQAGFFDTPVALGANITQPVSGNDGFIVAEAGPYSFSWALKVPNGSGNALYLPRIAVNGTVVESGPTFIYTGGGTAASGYTVSMASAAVLLAPGDRISPVVSIANLGIWQGYTGNFTGESSATISVMKICKIA